MARAQPAGICGAASSGLSHASWTAAPCLLPGPGLASVTVPMRAGCDEQSSRVLQLRRTSALRGLTVLPTAPAPPAPGAALPVCVWVAPVPRAMGHRVPVRGTQPRDWRCGWNWEGGLPWARPLCTCRDWPCPLCTSGSRPLFCPDGDPLSLSLPRSSASRGSVGAAGPAVAEDRRGVGWVSRALGCTVTVSLTAAAVRVLLGWTLESYDEEQEACGVIGTQPVAVRLPRASSFCKSLHHCFPPPRVALKSLQRSRAKFF